MTEFRAREEGWSEKNQNLTIINSTLNSNLGNCNSKLTELENEKGRLSDMLETATNRNVQSETDITNLETQLGDLRG